MRRRLNRQIPLYALTCTAFVLAAGVSRAQEGAYVERLPWADSRTETSFSSKGLRHRHRTLNNDRRVAPGKSFDSAGKQRYRAQSPDYGSALPNPIERSYPGPGLIQTPGANDGPSSDFFRQPTLPSQQDANAPRFNPTPGVAQPSSLQPDFENIGGVTPNFLGPIMPSDGYLQPDAGEGLLDVYPVVQETQTGRFSIGAGINSDLGILGNIVLDERNFSIYRWPSSFGDIFFGNAFRGDGQRFTINAVPGSVVQRYSVSFQEPYLFDTPVSFGLSGFFFNRFYDEWEEQRLGGNISYGYQVRPDLSVNLTIRAEQVRIRNQRFPFVPAVTSVLGENDIFSGRVSIRRDTRDSAFLPTQGHMFDLSFEQVFGDFDYPRVTADVRKYFMLYERPDRSGRHVVSLRGRAGISGSNTPVFEHFYAGGFSTLRGFRFRGVGPVVTGSSVGGEFMLLGSVEYLMPVTADDALRMVFFVDFGTVESRVELHADSFRIAPGFGLRMTVPGMGPAPIAVDFAWAINEEDTDRTRVFSFFVGLLR